MTGKIANLPPNRRRMTIKGVMRLYYSPFWQKWIAVAWPKGHGADSKGRAASREDFKTAVKLMKTATPQEYEQAIEDCANTGFLPRDLLMKAIYGLLVEAITTDGVLWQGARLVPDNIQNLLDSITDQQGSILVRFSASWQGLDPGSANEVLTINAITGMPEWQAIPPQEVVWSWVTTGEPDVINLVSNGAGEPVATE